jgi:hypothetical protein
MEIESEDEDEDSKAAILHTVDEDDEDFTIDSEKLRAEPIDKLDKREGSGREHRKNAGNKRYGGDWDQESDSEYELPDILRKTDSSSDRYEPHTPPEKAVSFKIRCSSVREHWGMRSIWKVEKKKENEAEGGRKESELKVGEKEQDKQEVKEKDEEKAKANSKEKEKKYENENEKGKRKRKKKKKRKR